MCREEIDDFCFFSIHFYHVRCKMQFIVVQNSKMYAQCSKVLPLLPSDGAAAACVCLHAFMRIYALDRHVYMNP